MTTTKNHTRIKDCLATLLLVPATGVALYHINRAIGAIVAKPMIWESAFRTWLLLTAEQLIPLVIGAFVAWLVARRSKTSLSIELGILTMLAVYIVMYLFLPGCDTKVYPNCGEGTAFVFFQWIGMFIVNALALVGLGYWFSRLNKRRLASADSMNSTTV